MDEVLYQHDNQDCSDERHASPLATVRCTWCYGIMERKLEERVDDHKKAQAAYLAAWASSLSEASY